MYQANSVKGSGIAQVCSELGIGRTFVYELIRSGQLRAVKIGRRTIVLSDDLNRYIAGLPTLQLDGQHELAS